MNMKNLFNWNGMESFVRAFQESKQKGTVSDFINEAINRARERLDDPSKNIASQQADSLQELLFLQTQGQDVPSLSFSITNLVTNEDYSVKRMAYYAMSQLVSDTNAIVMVTAAINHDLVSGNDLCKSLALSILPIIATPESAENLMDPVIQLFKYSNPGISQRAITCFYQLSLKFPNGAHAGISKLNPKALLEDGDAGHQLSVLSLLFEICVHNPVTLRNLIPTLFRLLSTAASPWILVKVLGIITLVLQSLDKTGREAEMKQALCKKLATPISDILDSSNTTCVILEVIKLITDGPMKSPQLIRVAADRAQDFIQNSDPNLRYLGLTCMTSLMKIDAKVIAQHREIIQQCLESEDPTCVLLAVDLLKSICSSKNISNIVDDLIDQIEVREAGFVRDALARAVIEICSSGDYERLTDLLSYVDILMDIHGYGISIPEISEQILMVALRVSSIRSGIVSNMLDVLREDIPIDSELTQVAAFIVGEYSDVSDSNSASTAFSLLFSPRLHNYSGPSQAACIQNAFKLFCKCSDNTELAPLFASALLAEDGLASFTSSPSTEVQDSASLYLSIVRILDEQCLHNSSDPLGLSALFGEQLSALAPGLQSRMPLGNLDLTRPIVSLDAESNELDLTELMGDEDPYAPLATKTVGGISGLDPKNYILPSSKKDDDSEALTILDPNVKITPPKKQRHRLGGGDGKVQIDPLFGAEKKTRKSGSPTSILGHIDLLAPLKPGETIPGVKPYSQDELTVMSSRQLSKVGKASEYERGAQEYSEGQLSISIAGMKPTKGGLEMRVVVVNTSVLPIEAMEFAIGNQVQVMRGEIPPNGSKTGTLAFRIDPPVKNGVAKMRITPTGGSGETPILMVKINAACFLEKAKQSEYEVAAEKCKEGVVVAAPVEMKPSEITAKVEEILHGEVFKVESLKSMAVLSKSTKAYVLALVRRGGKGFEVEVKTENRELAQTLAGDLDKMLNPDEMADM